MFVCYLPWPRPFLVTVICCCALYREFWFELSLDCRMLNSQCVQNRSPFPLWVWERECVCVCFSISMYFIWTEILGWGSCLVVERDSPLMHGHIHVCSCTALRKYNVNLSGTWKERVLWYFQQPKIENIAAQHSMERRKNILMYSQFETWNNSFVHISCESK